MCCDVIDMGSKGEIGEPGSNSSRLRYNHLRGNTLWKGVSPSLQSLATV